MSLQGQKHWSLLHFYKRQGISVRMVLASCLALMLWMLSGVFLPSKGSDMQNIQKSVNYRTFQSSAQLKQNILKISGIAISKKKAVLVAESSGTVEKILAQNGQFLQKGGQIIAIEAKNRKELYEKAKSKLSQGEIEFKATSALYKRQLASEIDLAKTRANLSSAEADLKQAELDYLNSWVLAPFNGYIDSINVNEGDYVSAGGAPIGTFVAAEPMVVKAEVSDAQVNSITVGAKVKIKTLNGFEKDGEVASIGKVINEATSSFPIEITFSNQDFGILHGQAVALKILKGDEKAHKVPQSVLTLNANNELGVKVLDENFFVRFYKANLIDEESNYAWITGLPDSANIISLGQNYLNDGEQIGHLQEAE